jgi:hypothetical protein
MPFDAEATPQDARKLVLQKARDLLAKEGWIQGAMHLQGQGYCSVGAIGYALAGGVVWRVWRDADVAEIYECSKLLGLGAGDLMIWNDRVARNKAEVLARFDAAIAGELVNA